MTDDRQRIRDGFGFTPPDEFFSFWEFARSIKPKVPTLAFCDLTMMDLAGPFGLLAGDFDNRKARYDPCLHWRYFGDPPEFVTILTGGTDGLHWGYVVDEPSQPPLGIVGYFAYDDVTVFQESASLFQLLENHLKTTLKETEREIKSNARLAKDSGVKRQLEECRKMLADLQSFVGQHKVNLPKTSELEFVDHCNPPPPFPFPPLEEFDTLPQLVKEGLAELSDEGYSDLNARLKIGRMLWHWHYDGNSQLEAVAFDLLDKAYESMNRKFLRHVLHQHRQHRHRKSLNVFE